MAQMHGLDRPGSSEGRELDECNLGHGFESHLGQAFFLSCLLYYMDVLIHFPIFYL